MAFELAARLTPELAAHIAGQGLQIGMEVAHRRVVTRHGNVSEGEVYPIWRIFVWLRFVCQLAGSTISYREE